MTRINLLPWREERKARRRKIFLAFLFGMAGVAAAAVWLADQVIDRAIERQMVRNSQLGKESTGLDSRIKSIDGLHEQREQVLERMKVVQGLEDDRSMGARLLDQLARAMPDGVQLGEVSVEGRTVDISGTAESNHDVAQFMRRLEASDTLQAPQLRQVQADDEHGKQGFQMMVRQAEPVEARQ